jgi:DNA-binding MarR family transcriptional regulator
MNQKQIGIILLVVGIIIACLVYVAKVREDRAIAQIIIAQGGSCYLPDGTCLHEDRDYTPFIIGWIVSGALLILGVYLVLFDKTQQALADHQRLVSTALEHAKRHDKEKDEFHAFLSAFSPEEQIVLRTIREEEGITQSTLRFKAGLSKTGLSIMLTDFEKRGLISREPKGKTNQVFLRKKF